MLIRSPRFFFITEVNVQKKVSYNTLQSITYYFFRYLFRHLSSFWVTKGMFVNAGETLGLSGNSRMSTDPHLHLTTKKDGKVFNPVILLKFYDFRTSHLDSMHHW